MTKSKSAILAASLCAAAFASAATAQTIVDAEKPADLVAAIQAMGFQARLDKDNVGDPMIRSSAGGGEFSIYFYGCTKNKRCQSLQFTAGYDLDDGTTLAVVEEWNESKRFASAYIDDEDDPFLRMDINTEGGITQLNFEKSFELWQTLKGQFEDHIGFNR